MFVNDLIRTVSISLNELAQFVLDLPEADRAEFFKMVNFAFEKIPKWKFPQNGDLPEPDIDSCRVSMRVLAINKFDRACVCTYDHELRWWNTQTHWGEVEKWQYLPE